MAKKKPIIGVRRGRYFEATKSRRGRNAEIEVLVWATDKKEGETTHEWVMLGEFPMDAAIDQAILQSK